MLHSHSPPIDDSFLFVKTRRSVTDQHDDDDDIELHHHGFKLLEMLHSNPETKVSVHSAIACGQEKRAHRYAVKKVPLNIVDWSPIYSHWTHEMHVGRLVRTLKQRTLSPAFLSCQRQLFGSSGSHVYLLSPLLQGSFLHCALQESRPLSLLRLQAVMAQVLHALETSQRLMHFVHYDLHTENVLWQDCTSSNRHGQARCDRTWCFERGPQHAPLYLPFEAHMNRLVRIIDLEKSRIRYHTKHILSSQSPKVLAVQGFEQFGIGSWFHGQFDMRLFALSLIHSCLVDVVTRSWMHMWKTCTPQLYNDWLDTLDLMLGLQHCPWKPPCKENKMQLSSVRHFMQCFSAMDRDDFEQLFVDLRSNWVWTRQTFPCTVSQVLDAPFFDSFRCRPTTTGSLNSDQKSCVVLSRYVDTLSDK